MSMEVTDIESGRDLHVRTLFVDFGVLIGDHRISMKDFLNIAFYALINADLEENDPRIKFVEEVKKLQIVDGLNAGQKKFLPQ